MKFEFEFVLVIEHTVRIHIGFMFVSIMSEQKIAASEPDVAQRTEIVKEIKKNVASLKTSIDQILHDMEYIRTTKLEILEKLDCIKNDVDSTQIQATLGKAKKIMKKSEENRRKLELVLRKMNECNLVHTFTYYTDPDIFNFDPKSNDVKNVKETQIASSQERIKLLLLENNKYTLTTEDKEKEEKEMKSKSWRRDSALRELQWAVKMKLYKLRHHYDKLPFEEVEERTLLPVSWRRPSGERA